MNGLDLYKSLILNLPKKDLTAPEKKDLIEKISQSDKEGHFLLYSLIKNYFINKNQNRESNETENVEIFSESENKIETLIIPYNGKKGDDKVDFNLIDFPNELRQLLYKFMILHTKKLQIDNEKQLSLSKHEN